MYSINQGSSLGLTTSTGSLFYTKPDDGEYQAPVKKNNDTELTDREATYAAPKGERDVPPSSIQIKMGESITATYCSTTLETEGLTSCSAVSVLTDYDYKSGIYRRRSLAHITGSNLLSPMNSDLTAADVVSRMSDSLVGDKHKMIVCTGYTGGSPVFNLNCLMTQKNDDKFPLYDLSRTTGLSIEYCTSVSIAVDQYGDYSLKGFPCAKRISSDVVEEDLNDDPYIKDYKDILKDKMKLDKQAAEAKAVSSTDQDHISDSLSVTYVKAKVDQEAERPIKPFQSRSRQKNAAALSSKSALSKANSKPQDALSQSPGSRELQSRRQEELYKLQKDNEIIKAEKLKAESTAAKLASLSDPSKLSEIKVTEKSKDSFISTDKKVPTTSL